MGFKELVGVREVGGEAGGAKEDAEEKVKVGRRAMETIYTKFVKGVIGHGESEKVL